MDCTGTGVKLQLFEFLRWDDHLPDPEPVEAKPEEAYLAWKKLQHGEVRNVVTIVTPWKMEG